MKDFGGSGVSDDMVLGKDENLFCIVEAQTAIKRLDLEPKITVILGNEGDRSAALLALLMKYYLLCQWSTTPIVNEVLLLSPMKYYSYRQWSTTPIANEVLLWF